MRVHGSVTSVSWIPSEAVTGLLKLGFTSGVGHYDSPPPDVLDSLEAMQDSDAFRFANRLEVWAKFDGEELLEHGHRGGLVMGSTTVRLGLLGVTFAGVPMPDLVSEPELSSGAATYRQTCGGRTAFPLPRRTSHAPFVLLQAPLVWTTLALTVRFDGTTLSRLEGASSFPRHWVYDSDGRLSHKDALTDWAAWTAQESWLTTPWGGHDSPAVVTAAETGLERLMATTIMNAHTRPEIRRLGQGKVLTRQGERGTALYLLLDGVLSVSVDGNDLVELGPGAIVGERAILEGGKRTSTLTAVTPVRVAVAPSSAIDMTALDQLSRGHRLEDVEKPKPD
jgi:Cyclic nucleotide-binding domain